MKQKDKEQIILKSGIEIHQQLDTNKLFCRCPSILRQDKPDFEVERKLHIVAGESGEIDEAVKFEASRGKKFIYQAYNDNTCLVELDEEPPHSLNQKALKIAVQISLLLNCEIIQDTQIMRKTVINGSNVSGFQRTVLIAKNGYVETAQGRVGIQSVMLEEDAARPAEQDENKAENIKTYKLDRLGIPLVEIATMPDIKNPEQAKEAALHIGEILRACKVKRGLGTIRQDVNMSIRVVDGKKEKTSSRIEIKGVQEPSLIVKTLETEMKRQAKLVKVGESKPEVRKAEEDGSTTFLRPLPGAARMYPETDLPLLHISRDFINDAKRELPRMRHEIKAELKAEGLSDEMVNLIIGENKISEYRELLGVYNKPDLIAKMLVLWKKEISSHEKISEKKIEEKLTLDVLESIINLIRDKKIDESQAKKIMLDIVKGKEINESLRVEKISNLEDEILKIVKEKPGLNVNAYMGLVMAKFKGKVSGKEVAEILRKLGKS
jgi:Glu-tRNA(Gln) amidotransferase subunit E-like FAD-binding protein